MLVACVFQHPVSNIGISGDSMNGGDGDPRGETVLHMRYCFSGGDLGGFRHAPQRIPPVCATQDGRGRCEASGG